MWFIRRLSHKEVTPQNFEADPDYITAPLPKILWIELTSKCPFDCVFCTRRSRFGAGQHMDFEIYKSLIQQLEAPEFIGLNYSGESIYYPRLLEAIRLAAATGASTEIVTAFSSISSELLRAIVASGLDRLAVSLHTMDAEQYKAIYQFSSLDLLKARIDEFLRLKREMGVSKPRLEFCFVAINDNLSQLPEVAAYARQVEVSEIFIHPVIGRHVLPYDFSRELAANRLRESFKADLRKVVSSVQTDYPEVVLTVLNPDIDPNPYLSHVPRYYAPRLPSQARIHSCDQDPWETVHILSNGNVVVCEVHDEVPLGSLKEQKLSEIWHSEKYRQFRRRYMLGTIPECRDCVWKRAFLPSSLASAIFAKDGMSAQLLRGWHYQEGEQIIWSKKESLIVLRNVHRGRRIRLVGILPDGLGETNVLRIECNGRMIGQITNSSHSFLSFDSCFHCGQFGSDLLHLKLTTSQLFRPALRGLSRDNRDLGFAFYRAEVLR